MLWVLTERILINSFYEFPLQRFSRFKKRNELRHYILVLIALVSRVGSAETVQMHSEWVYA